MNAIASGTYTKASKNANGVDDIYFMINFKSCYVHGEWCGTLQIRGSQVQILGLAEFANGPSSKALNPSGESLTDTLLDESVS